MEDASERHSRNRPAPRLDPAHSHGRSEGCLRYEEASGERDVGPSGRDSRPETGHRGGRGTGNLGNPRPSRGVGSAVRSRTPPAVPPRRSPAANQAAGFPPPPHTGQEVLVRCGPPTRKNNERCATRYPNSVSRGTSITSHRPSSARLQRHFLADKHQAVCDSVSRLRLPTSVSPVSRNRKIGQAGDAPLLDDGNQEAPHA